MKEWNPGFEVFHMMGCLKWFLIILLVLIVLAGIVLLIIKFGGVVLWTITGLLFILAIFFAFRSSKS